MFIYEYMKMLKENKLHDIDANIPKGSCDNAIIDVLTAKNIDQLSWLKHTENGNLLLTYIEDWEEIKIVLSKEWDFFKSESFSWIYEFDWNNLYYLWKDDWLLIFDGKGRGLLQDTSKLSSKFKNQLKEMLANQIDDQSLKDIIKYRDLDYNGWMPPADEKAENDLIQYIFDTATQKKVLISDFMLEELRFFLEDEWIISENSGIDYWDPWYTQKTNNNKKVENIIDSYLDSLKIDIN